MNSMSINRNVDVTPTVEEIAEIFSDLNEVDQALFFNEVARHFSQHAASIEIQACWVMEHLPVGSEGRRLVQALADFLQEDAT